MEFNLCHADAYANLWAAPLVAGSVLWAALIADQTWRARTSRSVPWKWVFLLALGTPIGAQIAGKVIEGPQRCSVGYMGYGVWMALPLCLPFLVARFLWQTASGVLLSARAVALLACLHACWTLALFPQELLKWTAWLPPELPAMLAPAPVLAAIGVVGMVLVQATVGSGARPGSWRAWASDRLQFCVAFPFLLLELQIAPAAIFPQGDSGDPVFSSPLVIALLTAIAGTQAWLRAAALRQESARAAS